VDNSETTLSTGAFQILAATTMKAWGTDGRIRQQPSLRRPSWHIFNGSRYCSTVPWRRFQSHIEDHDIFMKCHTTSGQSQEGSSLLLGLQRVQKHG